MSKTVKCRYTGNRPSVHPQLGLLRPDQTMELGAELAALYCAGGLLELVPAAKTKKSKKTEGGAE